MNTEDKHKMMIHEAFIERAAMLDQPFLLKGSYVSRQYFPPGVERVPADIDWVYMMHLSDVDRANAVFTDWVTQITEMDLNDGVQFRSFRENTFWRRIDYAMHIDFPTVNTDLIATANGMQLEFQLDISFNLPLPFAPVPLIYETMTGRRFELANSVPLSLQIAWKMHQTLIRPRMKDLFDLMNLVQHPDLNDQVGRDAMQALVEECIVDKLGPEPLKSLLKYDLAKLFSYQSIEAEWEHWRNYRPEHPTESYDGYQDYAAAITDVDELPERLSDFLADFQETMEAAGFTTELGSEFWSANQFNGRSTRKRSWRDSFFRT